MSVPYFGAATGTTVLSRTALAMTYPADSVGWIALAAVEVDGGPVVTVGAGWTPVGSANSPATTRGALALRRIAAGEPGTSTGNIFSWTGASFSQAGMICIPGCVSSGDPQSVAGTTNSGASGGTFTCTGLTTAHEECLVVRVCANPDVGGTHSASSDERLDVTSIAFYDEVQYAAGATGSKTIAPSASIDWVAFLVALRPEPIPVAKPTVDVRASMRKR